MSVPVSWVVNVLVFVCVCYQIRVKEKKHVSDLSKLDAFLHKSSLWYHMWRDHPFNQSNKATERTVGVEVGGYGGWGGGDPSVSYVGSLINPITEL